MHEDLVQSSAYCQY